MGDWLVGGLATSLLLTMGWYLLTKVLPRMAAKRIARPPQQPLTVLGDGNEHEVALPIDAETQLSTVKMSHDRLLREADDLILTARGAGLFAENLLLEAAGKAGDAVKLRPGSFEGNMMCGEIAVKRAQYAGTAKAVELLEQAVASFAEASHTKKGVVDTYVGRGWAHLERARRLTGRAAASGFLDAADVFLQGFRVNSHNLFVLRGWGIAVDGLARTLGDEAEPVHAAEESYRLALAEHRSGDHELYEWYAKIRSADEPVRMAMPAVRDRF